MWINIDQLEYLKEIKETGSVTKAADKLLRSKSAVTKAIQNLEEQVGFTILDRQDYRAKLTPEGQAFLDKAKNVLEEMDALKESCKLIVSKVETKVGLSISGLFDNYKLYPIIKAAANKFPQTQITLHRETLSGERMLFDELVDLAIFEGIRNQRDLEFKPLGKIELKLVIAKNHPFLKLSKEKRTFKELYRYPQIIQQSTFSKDEISVGVHKEAFKWFVTDTLSKKEIIMNGLGWGRLPEHVISKELSSGSLVHLKELKDDDSVQVYLAKRKKFVMGVVAQFVWDSL